MKKLLRIVLILAGIGIVLYLVSQKQSNTRQLWEDVVANVPTPDAADKGGSSE